MLSAILGVGAIGLFYGGIHSSSIERALVEKLNHSVSKEIKGQTPFIHHKTDLPPNALRWVKITETTKEYEAPSYINTKHISIPLSGGSHDVQRTLLAKYFWNVENISQPENFIMKGFSQGTRFMNHKSLVKYMRQNYDCDISHIQVQSAILGITEKSFGEIYLYGKFNKQTGIFEVTHVSDSKSY